MSCPLRSIAVTTALALACSCASKASPEAPRQGDPLTTAPPETLFQRGVELRSAGDFIRSEQYLAAARDRGYDEDKVVRELIGVCIDGSRYQAALRHAVPYLSRHPDDWALRHLVGSLYLATGDLAHAVPELERVTTEQPQAAEPHFTLARAYAERLDRPEEASANFRTYLQLAPEGEHAAEARAWLKQQEAAQ